MPKKYGKYLLSFLVITTLSLWLQIMVLAKHVSPRAPDFRSFYGIAWRGKVQDHLKFVRQMGYDYVFYHNNIELEPLSNGLYFYLETPEHFIYPYRVSKKQPPSPADVAFLKSYCALKDTNSPFPYNLATGWHSNDDTFTALLDFQQQRVINWAVDSVLNFVKKIEARNPNFHFGGFAWDEPRPDGDFWDYRDAKNIKASLATWHGAADGMVNGNKRHNYRTYTEGHFEYIKQLFNKTRARYPNARFITEPFQIYEDWIKLVQDRPDASQITPDILSQEGPGTAFVDDKRIFASGLIKKTNVYCTTPNVFDEEGNRTIAAKAAINGAGFGWYGRYGGTGNMPNFQNITEVPARLQLIRVLTDWENKNGTPLTKRTWQNGIYNSPTAYVSADVIAIVQPFTHKLFVVFLTMKGLAPLPAGRRAIAISNTDTRFIESGDGRINIITKGGFVAPRTITSLNRGFIVQLS